MKGTNKRSKKARPAPIVKNQNVKRVLLALALATVGLVVYSFAAQYTYQEKQKVELNKTLQELRVKQQELDKNKLDSLENQKKIEELQKQLQAKRDGQARALAEASVKRVQARVAVSNPQCLQWMAEAGIPATNATTNLILKESGCRYNARNASSGACGIPQALPCSKLPCSLDAAGAVCQLRWMDQYVKARYGSWDKAYATWLSRSPHWY